MFYYTYLIYITDTKSSLYGHIYYGQHRTNDLLDEYICSSKILSKKWFKRHPNGYYRKILQLYNSDEELNKAEYDLIHPHLGKDYCLNLIEGGKAGRCHPYICKQISEKVSEILKVRWTNPIYREKMITKIRETWNNESRKQIHSKKLKQYFIDHPEKRKEISKSLKNYYHNHPEIAYHISKMNSGENNPMYGKNSENYMTTEAIKEKRKKQRKQILNRRFLNNGKNCVLVKPEDINYYISQGYKYGKIQTKRIKNKYINI